MLKIHEYAIDTGNGISSIITEPLTGCVEALLVQPSSEAAIGIYLNEHEDICFLKRIFKTDEYVVLRKQATDHEGYALSMKSDKISLVTMPLLIRVNSAAYSKVVIALIMDEVV